MVDCWAMETAERPRAAEIHAGLRRWSPDLSANLDDGGKGAVAVVDYQNVAAVREYACSGISSQPQQQSSNSTANAAGMMDSFIASSSGQFEMSITTTTAAEGTMERGEEVKSPLGKHLFSSMDRQQQPQGQAQGGGGGEGRGSCRRMVCSIGRVGSAMCSTTELENTSHLYPLCTIILFGKGSSTRKTAFTARVRRTRRFLPKTNRFHTPAATPLLFSDMASDDLQVEKIGTCVVITMDLGENRVNANFVRAMNKALDRGRAVRAHHNPELQLLHPKA